MSERRDLPINFKPGDNDVICGKGRTCFNHIGNKSFRETIRRIYLQEYSNAKTKIDKSKIVSNIVDLIRSRSEGGFVKFDTTKYEWYEVGDTLAREKVGQTLRNDLHLQYRSANKAKKRRRMLNSTLAVTGNMMTMTNPMIANLNDDKVHHQLSSEKILDGSHQTMQTIAASNMCDTQFIKQLTRANLDLLNGLNETRDQYCHSKTSFQNNPFIGMQQTSMMIPPFCYNHMQQQQHQQPMMIMIVPSYNNDNCAEV